MEETVMVAADRKAAEEIRSLLNGKIQNGAIRVKSASKAAQIAAAIRKNAPGIMIVFPGRLGGDALKCLGLLRGAETKVIAVLPENGTRYLELLRPYPVRWFLAEPLRDQVINRLVEEAAAENARDRRIRQYRPAELCRVLTEFRRAVLIGFEKEMTGEAFYGFLYEYMRRDMFFPVGPFLSGQWAMTCTEDRWAVIRRHIMMLIRYFDSRKIRCRIVITPWIREPSRMIGMMLNASVLLRDEELFRNRKIFVMDRHPEISHGTNHPAVEKVLRLVEHNYSRHYTVSKIAQDTFFSENYLSVVFKREMGLSIGQFIRRYRLMLAREMLLNTKLSVKDIASENGFRSENYFCRCFKEQYGKSPLNYRKYEDQRSARRMEGIRLLPQ